MFIRGGAIFHSLCSLCFLQAALCESPRNKYPFICFVHYFTLLEISELQLRD